LILLIIKLKIKELGFEVSHILNNENDRLVLLFNLKTFLQSLSKKSLLILFYEIDINFFKTHIFYISRKKNRAIF